MELLEQTTSYKEAGKENSITNKNINDIIAKLNMYTNDPVMLTKIYTDILKDDNAMYILTKISQNNVFKNHFPEFYIKNKYGESVINCQQNTKYHRYGVFKHILCAIENAGKDKLKFNKNEIKILKWTMLLHDIGKAQTKITNASGYDSFAGHENVSYNMARGILDRFSFSLKEKQIILALIKYHDKFLNEGEWTYDNLSFLAKELDDKEELFNLLIEVKLADNKAKSIDVYNTYTNIKNRYYQFANLYFKSKVNIEKENCYLDDNIKLQKNNENTEVCLNKEIDKAKELDICKEIIEGKCLKYYYTPVIDLKNKKICGYESYCKIVTNSETHYSQIIRNAKINNLYTDIQQAIFLKSIEQFNKYDLPNFIEKYTNIDLTSYKDYKEKERLLEMLKNKKMVVTFNVAENMDVDYLDECLVELRNNKVKVSVENLNFISKLIENSEFGNVDVIKYKLMDLEQNNVEQIKQLITFCSANGIVLIISFVDTKDKLSFLLDLGVRYVQGECFGKMLETPNANSSDVKKIIKKLQEDKIL